MFISLFIILFQLSYGEGYDYNCDYKDYSLNVTKCNCNTFNMSCFILFNNNNNKNDILIENENDNINFIIDTNSNLLNIKINGRLTNLILINFNKIHLFSKLNDNIIMSQNGFNYSNYNYILPNMEKSDMKSDMIIDGICYMLEFNNKNSNYLCTNCIGILLNGLCYSTYEIYSNLDNCIKLDSNLNCIECSDNSYLESYIENGKNITKCIKYNQYPFICPEFYIPFGNKCLKCPNDCSKCHVYGSDINDYYLNLNISTSNSSPSSSPILICDFCLYSSYSNDLLNPCIKNDTVYYSTINSTINKLTYFNCSNLNDCYQCDDSKCLICNSNYYQINGSCYLFPNLNKCENDQSYINGKCINKIPSCDIKNQLGCIKCKDGYYPDNGICYSCSSISKGCITCLNSSICLECDSNHYLQSGYCYPLMEEIKKKCLVYKINKQNVCLICNNGYYLDENICLDCQLNCNNCVKDKCITCKNNYFLFNNSCISYDYLFNCSIKSNLGCKECNNGYYLNSNDNSNSNSNKIFCSKCFDNCIDCINNNTCFKCKNDYILFNTSCIHYSLIDHCKMERDNKCYKCSFLYKSNDLKCDLNISLLISIIILSLIIIFIPILIIIGYIVYKLVSRFLDRKLNNTFKIKYCNVKFYEIENGILLNDLSLDFNEIEVNKKTRTLFCIGNKFKRASFQFIIKDNPGYEIEFNPSFFILNKGEAIEIEIFIKPLYTLEESDILLLLVKRKGIDFNKEIKLNIYTNLSTYLNPNDIYIKKQLGEGSFGIVYKGEYKGNKVAIKRMKVMNDRIREEEFKKEVSMLDKFRNDYIVHFYGSVIISKQFSMVTELAKYGSLQDLISKNNDLSKSHYEIKHEIRMKLIYDCSKGIQYLHSNGILHRDIKPDNFLVFNIISIDHSIINCKLTDFGSSRNINMLMTNITFTKGIGTPKYMAPEILNRQHYKKPADIYSFSITMLEIYLFKMVFNKTEFRYPWDIATFVCKGNRLNINSKDEKYYVKNDVIRELINCSWRVNPLERYNINDIVNKLEKIIPFKDII